MRPLPPEPHRAANQRVGQEPPSLPKIPPTPHQPPLPRYPPLKKWEYIKPTDPKRGYHAYRNHISHHIMNHLSFESSYYESSITCNSMNPSNPEKPPRSACKPPRVNPPGSGESHTLTHPHPTPRKIPTSIPIPMRPTGEATINLPQGQSRPLPKTRATTPGMVSLSP